MKITERSSKGSGEDQKQPPAVVYEKSFSQKFCNVRRKTPMLKSLFNKFYFIFNAGAWLWIWRNIKSTCFEEHLRSAASEWRALIFTNDILKFSYWDKFLHFLSADFLLGFFLRLYFWGVLGQLTPRKFTPNLKTNPKPNPTPNQRAIFLGGNCLVVPQL